MTKEEKVLANLEAIRLIWVRASTSDRNSVTAKPNGIQQPGHGSQGPVTRHAGSRISGRGDRRTNS